MSLSNLIKSRRSVRAFDSSYNITDDEHRELLTAGALAPSSYNMQNRHFVSVLDDDTKAELAGAAFGQAQVRDAAVVIVVTGSRNAYKKTERYLRDAPVPVRDLFETVIPAAYADNDRLARDEDCRSVAFAGMNIMLMAVELGLDSCPMIGFEPDKVSSLLGLPKDHEPLLIIAVGKAAEPAPGRLGLLDLDELVSVNRFGSNTLSGPALV